MGQLLEFRSGQIHVKVLRSILVGSDERQVDVRGGRGGKLLLGLLGSLFQSLQRHLVVRQIDAFLLLELREHVVGQYVIKVIAAESGIAVRGQNFDNTVADLNDGNIKCTAAEVVHQDLLLALIVEAIGQSGGSRLIDDTLYLKSGDLPGILRRLSLRIIEVRRNSNDSLIHFVAQIAFRIRFQLLEDHRGDLLRGVSFSINIDTVIRAHLSLDGGNGLFCVGYSLTLCGLTDETLTGLRERNYTGGSANAFCICDNNGLAAFHNSYAAVGRSKVDSDYFTHDIILLHVNVLIKNLLIYLKPVIRSVVEIKRLFFRFSLPMSFVRVSEGTRPCSRQTALPLSEAFTSRSRLRGMPEYRKFSLTRHPPG